MIRIVLDTLQCIQDVLVRNPLSVFLEVEAAITEAMRKLLVKGIQRIETKFVQSEDERERPDPGTMDFERMRSIQAQILRIVREERAEGACSYCSVRRSSRF